MGRWTAGDSLPWTGAGMGTNPAASTAGQQACQVCSCSVFPPSAQSRSSLAETDFGNPLQSHSRSRFAPHWGLHLRSALNAPPSAPQGYAPAESPAENQNIKKADISNELTMG